MSIDGSKNTHDFIRKPGSFDETLEKVKVLNEAGIHTSIIATISRLNINEVPDFLTKCGKFFSIWSLKELNEMVAIELSSGVGNDANFNNSHLYYYFS